MFSVYKTIVYQQYPKVSPWAFVNPFPVSAWIGLVIAFLIVTGLLVYIKVHKKPVDIITEVYKIILSQGVQYSIIHEVSIKEIY